MKAYKTLRLFSDGDCIGMKACKKKRHTSDGDCISNLHENLLSLILSRLPTKDAVRTSILSKDWKYKWTASCNVDIEDDWKKEVFVEFVDRILVYLEHITNFRLVCRHMHDLRDVQRWICTASGHDLESVVANIRVQGLVYPSSLFNSTLLRKLDLQGCGTLDVNAINFAPNLTNLYLYGLDIVNGNHYTSTLTFTVPLLQTFTTRSCKWFNVKSVEIYAPSLTSFLSEPTNDEEAEYEYSFVIHAPRLVTFECSYGLPEKIDLINGSSTVSASFWCEGETDSLQLLRDIGLRVGKLLNKFTNLEDLLLTGFVAEVSQLGPPLDRHDKLRRLHLRYGVTAKRLFEILHVTPSLKVLEVNVINWVDFDYGALEHIASCIVSNLEEVKLIGFFGETPQYNLAKLLLRNGKQLRNMTIITDAEPVKQKEFKECLLALPICSPCIMIEIDVSRRYQHTLFIDEFMVASHNS